MPVVVDVVVDVASVAVVVAAVAVVVGSSQMLRWL